MSDFDLIIIGAGPSGMGAAIRAQRHGLRVAVFDEQPAPGGQIWRSVETAHRRDNILGPSYYEGRNIAKTFRNSGAAYFPDAKLWRIEPGIRAFVTRDGKAETFSTKSLILATGAQERPAPFPGWTLPGVLTVGAAQILLKNAGQIPEGRVWIAGSGPLPLLYMVQLLKAGGKIAGFLDTTPPGQWTSAVRHLPKALRAWRDLLKGIQWTTEVRRNVPVIAGVSEIEALGDQRICGLRYSTAQGTPAEVDADLLLIHEGVIPHIHAALSQDCQVIWDETQQCFKPVVDQWGESSEPNLYIAGDGAGIGGAKAALLRGEISALRVAGRFRGASDAAMDAEAAPLRAQLERELAVRPFLDAMYKPRQQIFAPEDRTIICRCEEVTAGTVRALSKLGRPGPGQMKAATRAGMGPCQGRQCGYTVTRLLAASQDREPDSVGFFKIRPPLKPVTIGELAAVAPDAPHQHEKVGSE